MATEAEPWSPNWAVAPGEILAEVLEERGISQAELARRMDRPTKTINEIIKAKTALTPETALQLELTLGVSAATWTGLESTYRQQLARQNAARSLASEADLLRAFPVSALERHGVIEVGTSPGHRVLNLLRFFGVSSPKGWQNSWLSPKAAFRESNAFRSAPESVATWLRWGQIESAKLVLAPYSVDKFAEVLRSARSWTRERPVSLVLDRLKQSCAESGVAFVLIPELPGLRLSGACHYLDDGHPIIQLTLRHKRDDQLWFTFFHEAGHLVTNPYHVYVDSADEVSSDDEELVADKFARDALIPPDQWKVFVRAADFSESSVRQFSRLLEVAPGVVVGRLQRENLIPRAVLNGLKMPGGWTSD